MSRLPTFSGSQKPWLQTPMKLLMTNVTNFNKNNNTIKLHRPHEEEANEKQKDALEMLQSSVSLSAHRHV